MGSGIRTEAETSGRRSSPTAGVLTIVCTQGAREASSRGRFPSGAQGRTGLREITMRGGGGGKGLPPQCESHDPERSHMPQSN